MTFFTSSYNGHISQFTDFTLNNTLKNFSGVTSKLTDGLSLFESTAISIKSIFVYKYEVSVSR